MGMAWMVAAAVAAVVASWAFNVLVHLVWRPHAVTRKLRAQGLRGPGYRFYTGNLGDIKRLRAEGAGVTLDVGDHDFIPMVQPHFRKWISLYGRTFVYWTGARPNVCVADVNVVKQVLSDRTGLYPKNLLNPHISRLLGKGLVLTDGDDWKRHRKVVHPAFSMDKLKMMTTTMSDCAQSMMSEWEAQLAKGGAVEVELGNRFEELTADVISHTAFGSSYVQGKKVFLAQRELQFLAFSTVFAAPAPPALKAAAPKPKSIAAARATRMAKRSPTGNANANAAPQPRPPRRAFGTTRSSNVPVEKPPPPLQKPSKVSPPPPKKPSKLSPQPLPKPSKTSPPAVQKSSKLSPPATQKPSKLSPPNPVRATKPSKLAAKPLKKVDPGADVEAKAKKRNQRVTFQEADVGAAAPRSGEKAKAYADDTAGHTPMVAMRAAEKTTKVLAAETPFFSAQNCSSCTLDQLESAAYWLAQIRLAESVGKHRVAAAFFRLAFECQAQPIHRIQSELRSYAVRHDSAGTLTPLFDDLLTAHGMPVNQPKFDADVYEKIDTPIANAVDKNTDTATLKVDECLECDDLIDVGVIIADKHDEDAMDQSDFQRKLDESFEFDDSEAVIVEQLDEENSDLLKNIEIKVPCSNETIQSACRSSTEKLSPRESVVAMDSSFGHLSLDKLSDKLSPSMGSSSSKRLSSGSSFDKKSPLSSERLTSSCPSYKKSAFTRNRSSKQMASDSHSDAKPNAIAGVPDHESKVIQDVASECPALFSQLESRGPVDAAANNEMH